MPRPQFTLRALLVAILAVACFFGGMAMQKRLDKPLSHTKITVGGGDNRIQSEKIVMRDGTVWHRGFNRPLAENISRVTDDNGQSVRRSTRESLGSKRRRPLFTHPLDPQ